MEIVEKNGAQIEIQSCGNAVRNTKITGMILNVELVERSITDRRPRHVILSSSNVACVIVEWSDVWGGSGYVFMLPSGFCRSGAPHRSKTAPFVVISAGL